MINSKTYMEIAKLIAKHGKCLNRKVGAIIVKDNRIISTGYNGTPIGYADCLDYGCIKCYNKINDLKSIKDYKCSCVHAELNAILYASKSGINIEGSTLFTTSSPCIECSKAIINVGIKTIYYSDVYEIEAFELLEKCKIEVIKNEK